MDVNKILSFDNNIIFLTNKDGRKVDLIREEIVVDDTHTYQIRNMSILSGEDNIINEHFDDHYLVKNKP